MLLPSWSRRWIAVAAICFSASLWFHGTAAAQVVPTLKLVASGLSSPVGLVNAHDGSNRLFIIEQGGDIKIYDGTQVLATPFLNIASRVLSGGERGLLGLAFDANYASNGFFYVYYTSQPAGAVTIARYSVTANPNVGDPNSEVILKTQAHSDFGNHNGGSLLFGPDGCLYAGIGDGGSGGDPNGNGQNLNTLLAKIIRINPSDGAACSAAPGNPFVGMANVRDEIWALGVRNPWRITFDRLTGDLLIADVGQGTREEVNIQPPGVSGRNYCWRRLEGTFLFDAGTACTDGTPTVPIIEYDHSGGKCSITGGYRYRGSAIPSLVGTYFYADYCTGQIWGATLSGGVWTSTQFFDTTFNISTFGEDESGEIYVVDLTGGAFYRLVDSHTATTLSATPNASVIGDTVTFTATVTGSGATGTVTFKDGATTIGSGTLSNGAASFSTAALAIGDHTITAAYGGDATFAASTSPALTQTVIAMSLQIAPATNMASAGSPGGPFSPPSFQYQLSANGGSVNYSITGLPSWLNVSSSSGTVTATPTIVTFTVNSSANSLPIGAYNATISIANTTNGEGSATRNAALTVNSGGTAPPASQTWVSGNGDDANDCTLVAPCQTFAAAIARTTAGGEIYCLDPGGFGAVTIDKAISIICQSGTAGVLASGTHGVIVTAAAPTDRVYLEGLDIEGLGTGLNGIHITGAAKVTIKNTSIRRFTGIGVNLVGAPNARAYIIDSLIAANAGGFNVQAAAGGNFGTLVNTVVDSNTSFAVQVTSAANKITLVASNLTGSPAAINAVSGGSVVSMGPKNFLTGSGAPTSTAPLR